jgi:Ca2+-binding RTX toxin-like protein
VELAGQGYDSVFVTASTWSATADSEIEFIAAFNTLATFAMNLAGNAFAQLIAGNNGANRLFGGFENDTLFGAQGNDYLNGGIGTDSMDGGGGNDTYEVNTSSDVVVEAAGSGADRVLVRDGIWRAAAGQEIELIAVSDVATTQPTNLFGNEFGQRINGSNGINRLDGGGGDDTLSGADGDDVLIGGTGIDRLFGGAGNDTYFVDETGDQVFETSGEGFDTVNVTVSTWSAGQNQSIERIVAFASAGAANITGNSREQEIIGNTNTNTLSGGFGNDTLDGGRGNDVLTGGGNSDVFRFSSTLALNNIDTITDFNVAADRIILDSAIFADIGIGVLSEDAFNFGPVAFEQNDRIMYHIPTGRLIYDADGTDGGAQFVFAVIAPNLALTAAHFEII